MKKNDDIRREKPITLTAILAAALALPLIALPGSSEAAPNPMLKKCMASCHSEADKCKKWFYKDHITKYGPPGPKQTYKTTYAAARQECSVHRFRKCRTKCHKDFH